MSAMKIQLPAMRLPLWLKVIWTLWVIVWVPLYWKNYGAQNFLWFCDMANVFILAGLWLESALIFSWQATGLLIFQTLYAIDLVWALVAGKHIIGGTEYMFDVHVPLFLRLISLFHIVTPPLLLWAIYRLGYDKRGWKYQTLTAWIVVPLCYFWRPEFGINWARGPLSREQHFLPGIVYLLAYLIVVPALVYWPTHRALLWWSGRSTRFTN
jgi:hypothetical protein